MAESLKKMQSQDSVKYEKVPSEGANPFGPRSSNFGPRFQMGGCFFLGIMLMLSHHFYYKYLDGKPIDYYLFTIDNHTFKFTDQSLSSIIGNSIAYAARTVLSAGIGIVFIQVFWSKLRNGKFSVKQMDTIMACKGHPFTLSAFRTFCFASGLAAIALMATLMACIAIFVPGSLRIQTTDFNFGTPCVVRTISLEKANISSYVHSPKSSTGNLSFGGAQARLMRLSSQVLMSGAALAPENLCMGMGACQYEIEFNAPIMNCSPVSPSFNYTSWLPPPDNETAPVRVWRAHEDDWPVSLTIATRYLATNNLMAVSCVAYNATYHAYVTPANSSDAVVYVYQTDVHNKLTSVANGTRGSQSPEDYYAATQYNAVVSAFTDVLRGTIDYRHDSQEFTNGYNPIVAYSALFEGSSDEAWILNPELPTTLGTLMQNISISLLNSRFSKEGSATVLHNATCWYSSYTYSYNRAQLLVTYGAALSLTAVCIFFGFRAIQQNRTEESIGFSRILGAILDKSLFDHRHELSQSSQLTAGGSPDGQLRLVHTTYGPD